MSNIKDLSLELTDTDSNYQVSVSKYSVHGELQGTSGRVYVSIFYKGYPSLGIGGMKFVFCDELVEFLRRLGEYMKERGFDVSIDFTDVNPNFDLEDDYERSNYIKNNKGDAIEKLVDSIIDNSRNNDPLTILGIKMYFSK